MDGRQHAWLPVTSQDTGGAAPSRKLRLPSASSAPSTEMRHERRRTAAHLLAIDPEGATDLGHLRTRFVRRQRTKEAAEILRGGSATNSAASISESLQRSDSFSSTTSGFGGSYRGGSYRGEGSFANFSGSFLSNVGLDSVRANGSARSDWNDQWSRGGSWMSRGGSWMSFADNSDLQPDNLRGDSGTDSFLLTVDAAKQQLLQCRAAFHDLELEQILRLQRSGSASAVFTLPNGIEEAIREFSEKSRQAAGPSVDSKELLEHPQRMPNLLRASSTCVVGLPDFKRGDSEGESVSDEEEENRDGWHNGVFYDPRLRRTAYRHRLPMSVWARWLSTHAYFRGYIIFLVALSSIVLAVQVEVPPEEWRTHLMMNRLDQFILLSFMVEILLKWIDSFRTFWHDGWNAFDFVITLMSLLPELLSLFNSGGSLDSGLPKLVRQLRVLRALRSFKMIAKFGTLKVIIATILETFSSIGNIMLLIVQHKQWSVKRQIDLLAAQLVIVMYIYGVVACHLFEHYSLSAEHGGAKFPEKFASLDQSFVSLFQLLTLDQWHVIYKDFMDASGLPNVVVTTFIVSWVWLGAFVFRNIFVGVIVHGFQQARATSSHTSDVADNVDGKTNGAATGLGKEQTEHSGSGNLNQGEVVAEVVAGGRRGRRLALDSADPAGALAMTRAWLAERDEWMNSKDISRLQRTDKGPAGLFGGRLRTIETAREKQRQLLRSRDFGFHPRRRPSDDLPGSFAGKIELSAQSRRATSKLASKRATQSAYASAGGVSHFHDAQGKLDSELPGIDEESEQQQQQHHLLQQQEQDGAAHSRVNEDGRRGMQGVATDDSWYGEALWPRAALLEYFELLTALQDNMREYEELQAVATGVLVEIMP